MPGPPGAGNVGHRERGGHEHGEIHGQGHFMMATLAEHQGRGEAGDQSHCERSAAAAPGCQRAGQQGDEGRGRQP